MSFRNSGIHVNAYWFGRSLEAQDAFAEIGRYLVYLRRSAGIFDNIFAMDRRGYTRLPPDLSGLDEQLKVNLDDDVYYYYRDGSRGPFTMTSRAEDGFRGAFADSNTEKTTTADVSVWCGHTLWPGERIVAGPNHAIVDIKPDLATSGLLRTVFKETIRFWRPADAQVAPPGLWQALGKPRNEVDAGWLTYIADPEIVRDLPPGVKSSTFEDGVIIEAADAIGSAEDPAFVAQVAQLQDRLGAAGWLNRRKELSARLAPEDFQTAA